LKVRLAYKAIPAYRKSAQEVRGGGHRRSATTSRTRRTELIRQELTTPQHQKELAQLEDEEKAAKKEVIGGNELYNVTHQKNHECTGT
jgi:hypothetical protein